MERMSIGIMQSLYNIIIFTGFIWITHVYLTSRYKNYGLWISLSVIVCLICLFNSYLQTASVAVRNIIFLCCILIPIYIFYQDSILWKLFVMFACFSFVILPEVIFDFFCYFILHTPTPEVLTSTWYGWPVLYIISFIPFILLIYLRKNIFILCHRINRQVLFIVLLFLISTILLPSLCILSFTSTSILVISLCCIAIGYYAMIHLCYQYQRQKKLNQIVIVQQNSYQAYLTKYDQYTQKQQAILRHELGNIVATAYVFQEQKEKGDHL